MRACDTINSSKLGMRDFITSKVLSLTIPLALIGYGALAFTGQEQTYWWFLVIVTMILGYVHFIIGFTYQLRSLRRAPNRNRNLIVFFLLTAFSILFCAYFIFQDLAGLLAMLVIGYFILHGALNEKTLLYMQTGIDVPTIYFMSLASFFTAVVYGSLTHPSFFFDGSIHFYSISEAARQWAITHHLGTDPQYVAVLLFFIAFALFLYSIQFLWKRSLTVLLHAVIFAATIAFFFFYYPLNYVYLYHLYLGYHFIVWSVVFYQKTKRERPERTPAYIRHHLYVLIPCTLLLIPLLSSTSGALHTIAAHIFDVRIFLTASFLHITVSFMNEPWFKRMLAPTSRQ